MVKFSPSKEYVLEEERFVQDESSEKESVEEVKEAVFSGEPMFEWLPVVLEWD
jgi:hypothetical protein